MIEGQWRAARALIGWSQGDLARQLGVSALTIKRLEAGGRNVSDEMRQRAKSALEAAGVEFIPSNGGGPGVRLSERLPMTVEECEEIGRRIATAAERLIAEPDVSRANDLIALCQGLRPTLPARFGNVREKIGGIVEAAEAYKRPGVTRETAEDALRRELGKMELAIAHHRSAASW